MRLVVVAAVMVLFGVSVASAKVLVEPCAGEDPRFIADARSPDSRVPAPPNVRRVGVFLAVDFRDRGGSGTSAAGPGDYRLTLWESLSAGSGGYVDYKLTIAKPGEWHQSVWEDSAHWAFLRVEGQALKLVVARRVAENCTACPNPYEVAHLRWSPESQKLVNEETYRTRCGY